MNASAIAPFSKMLRCFGFFYRKTSGPTSEAETPSPMTQTREDLRGHQGGAGRVAW